VKLKQKSSEISRFLCSKRIPQTSHDNETTKFLNSPISRLDRRLGSVGQPPACSPSPHQALSVSLNYQNKSLVRNNMRLSVSPNALPLINSNQPQNIPTTTKSVLPIYWKSPKAEIGIIFTKEDSPKFMQKRARMNNILQKRVEREEKLVRKKYMVNHPVVQLLEKNIKKIDVNEIFINDRGFNNLKEFYGIAMRPSAECKPTMIEELGTLSIKQNMHIKQKIGKSSLNNTFYL